ncbi:30S ribosomal protein S8 [Patescibacteria group bacterium]
MTSDPIADLLTRIRNAYAVNKKTVSVPYSNRKHDIVKILLEKNYLKEIEVTGKIPEKNIELTLKYPNHEAAITSITRISKPGVRIYASVGQLPKYLKGLGITIISTSKGLMTARQAKQKNFGGEVVCQVK